MKGIKLLSVIAMYNTEWSSILGPVQTAISICSIITVQQNAWLVWATSWSILHVAVQRSCLSSRGVVPIGLSNSSNCGVVKTVQLRILGASTVRAASSLILVDLLSLSPSLEFLTLRAKIQVTGIFVCTGKGINVPVVLVRGSLRPLKHNRIILEEQYPGF